MLIKGMAIASAAALGLLFLGYGASAGPASKIPAPFASPAASAGSKGGLTFIEYRHSHRRMRYRHSRFANHGYGEYRGYGYGSRNSGPPYDSCYMKCIFSSHPADFCRAVSHQHFCY
jgi:hypothetical protein